MVGTVGLDEMLEQRTETRLERLASFLNERRFSVPSSTPLLERVMKKTSNTVADLVNTIAVDPTLGLILPSDLQIEYAMRANKDPRYLSYLSVSLCAVSQVATLGVAYSLAHFGSADAGESAQRGTAVVHLLDWVCQKGSSGLNIYAYAGLVDVGARVIWLCSSRKPVGGMVFEIPYQIKNRISRRTSC